MLFMVEMCLHPGHKAKAVEAFESQGPNRYPGVALRSAWIGSREEVVYVLVECESEALVQKACEAWSEHGEPKIQPVVDIQQY